MNELQVGETAEKLQDNLSISWLENKSCPIETCSYYWMPTEVQTLSNLNFYVTLVNLMLHGLPCDIRI